MRGAVASERLLPIAGQSVVVLGLIALLYGPLAATALQAARGDEGASTSAGLIDATAFGREAALVAGPAFETIRVVVLAVAIALAIGLPMALALFRTDLPGRQGLILILMAAAAVPMPLYAAGWLGGFGGVGYRQVFGEAPILVGWSGSAFVHAMAGVPWVALLSGVGLLSVEGALEESALLERPGWRVALGVTLRRSLGAIAGSALLVAVAAVGEMTITDLLLVRTFAEEAYVQYGLGRPPAAVALVAIPPTAALLVLIALASRSILRDEPPRLASATLIPRPWRLGRWRIPVGLAAWMAVLALVGPPTIALAARAGRIGGDAALGLLPRWSVVGLIEALMYAAREVVGPLGESAMAASGGATLATILAWGLGWLSKGPGPWRWVTAATAALLLAVPGPVAGMGLKLAYLHIPPVSDTVAILMLGAAVRALPFALLVLWPAIRSLPPSFLETAELEGLGPFGRLWRVSLPLTMRATLAAWGVSFVLGMGELPIANLVYPAGWQPLTVLLWSQMHFGVDSRICAFGLVLIAVYGLAGTLAITGLARAYRTEG